MEFLSSVIFIFIGSFIFFVGAFLPEQKVYHTINSVKPTNQDAQLQSGIDTRRAG